MPLIRGKSPLGKITAHQLLSRWPDTNMKAILIGLCGFVAFSVSDATAKYLTLSYEPITIICFGSLFSALFGLALAPLLGGLKPALQSRHRNLHIVRAIFNTVITFLIIMAFAHLPLATVYTIIFTAPFFTAIMAVPIFKEKIEKRGWVAIIAGFIGVLIMVRPGFEGFDPWFLVPLVASVFIAGLFLLARPLTSDDPVLCLSLYPALLNIMLLPFVALSDLPRIEDLWLFAIDGIFVACGLTGLGIAFRIGKAAIISPLQYTQMIWAVILGYFLFNDWPDALTFIGAAIIIASGIFLIRAEHRDSKSHV